jgi:long-chain acyl-CoA synthetase
VESTAAANAEAQAGDAAPAVADLPPTIAQLAFFASGRFPKPDTIGQCRASGVVSTSSREFLDQVRDTSLGLSTLGMAAGDRVALLSENRPEWLIVDLAIQAAGAITIPIYPTLSPEQVAFILRDSGARMVVTSTRLQLDKLLAAEGVPALQTIVAMDDSMEASRDGILVLSLASVAARGHARILEGWGVAREFHDRAKAVSADDIATIVYTSGTTGEPKGVMLTHGNLVSNIAGVQRVLELGPDDIGLSFLPLCHAFERLVAYCYLVNGVAIAFAESFNTIARDLSQVRPTVLTGVPRVFEKLQERVLAKGHDASVARRAIFRWAVRLAGTYGRSLEERRASSWLRLKVRVADRLVFRRIRDVLGGRLRFAVSGGAPLPADVGRFFYGAGVPILEGYGLTETAPVLTVMRLNAIRFGTVGQALPGVDLSIAPDGEILARGPNVMAGYHHQPEQTAAVLQDGWFHTGDIGTLDPDGYLHITDRKKELIVTSGGKNVAPQPIENAFRSHPLIAEAVLIGEQRPFLTLLVMPNIEELARRIPSVARLDAESVARDDVLTAYQGAIDAINPRFAQFERVKRFALLWQPFSTDSGELTPTLKIKRRVIEQRYRNVIEELYRTPRQ